MKWLIDTDVFKAMDSALLAGRIPSAEEEAAHASALAFDDDGAPRIYSAADGVGVISMRGVLTDRPNLLAKWFGGGNTTYSEIRQALALSEQSPDTKKTKLFIDSPGGQASAEWVDTMDAIAAAKKPVEVVVGSLAASAAYGIASQADNIVAQNRLSRVGSVGVVQTFRNDDSTVEVTSSNAPNKRPDPTTAEGVAAVRKEIDAIENIFMEAIAAGRDTNIESVKANYGQGGTVLAGDAIARGMIDGLVANQTNPADGGKTTGANKMDLITLKNEHPAVFAEAVDAGVQQERDRVSAHLIKGKASGALDVALDAIENGHGMTATIDAKYFAAGLNKRDDDNRKADDADASAALKNADTSADKNDSEEDQVLALVSEQMGE